MTTTTTTTTTTSTTSTTITRRSRISWAFSAEYTTSAAGAREPVQPSKPTASGGPLSLHNARRNFQQTVGGDFYTAVWHRGRRVKIDFNLLSSLAFGLINDVSADIVLEDE